MAINTFTGDGNAWLRGESDAGTWTETFEGAVLQTFERNGYDDSDFIALVWDDEREAVIEVTYATTRGWTYANSAVIDATPEVLAKAQAYMRACRIDSCMRDAETRARTPLPGKTVKILPTATGRDRRHRGQVIPAGSVAYVAARMIDGYKSSRWGTAYRLALQFEGRMIYLDEDAVEVIDPEQFMPDRAEVDAATPPPEAFTNFHRPVPGFVAMVS